MVCFKGFVLKFKTIVYMKKHLLLFIFSMSWYAAYSQIPETKYYNITISLPDSINYVKVSAKLDIYYLKVLEEKTLKIDLCKGFEGVAFTNLNIFLNDEEIDFTIKKKSEITLKLPASVKLSDKTSIVFNYELRKTPDFESISYSDFAFQANNENVHINAAITRTDNWIPKLPNAHLKRLPPFSITIIAPYDYEVMASGKHLYTTETQSKNVYAYKSYDGITDRGMYFFISKNRRVEKIFTDGFKLTMYVPENALQENVEYLSDMVHQAYRFYEATYGKTNLNEYKLNSFTNRQMEYSGLFNACNVPQWLFTKPINNNELYVPVRDLLHEVSHTWWGNMVAPDAGSDYWLFEAFAKFSEPVFLKTIVNYDIENLYRKRLKIIAASNADYQPAIKFSSEDKIPQFLKNEAAYFKGALFLFSLKQLVGEDNFWKGMQEYVAANRNKMVNYEDYYAAIQNSTKVNIQEYYDDFLNKPGLAEYAINIMSEKFGHAYLHTIEITNTGNMELFADCRINADSQWETIYLYIPKGEKKTVHIKSKKPDTTNLISIDPEEVFLVREQGMVSPGAKLYTDSAGKVRVTTIVEGSPFQKAGLQDNMIILSINGENISDKDIYEQNKYIQRMKGTKLKIATHSEKLKEIEYIVCY
jgi:aminopeptidase N